jgi:cytochrome c-type biogenesis protein CcmE
VNARAKFMAGGILIFGSAAYLMASSISETGLTWISTSELSAKLQSDSSLSRREWKVGAKVVPGSIIRAENGRDVSFLATDGVKELKVIYDKTPPDTFSDSADVILTGVLLADGSFKASELLAKCASRFEVAPDTNDLRYRNTPGYKAAKKVGA